MRIIRFALVGALPLILTAIGIAGITVRTLTGLYIVGAFLVVYGFCWLILLGREHLTTPRSWAFAVLPALFSVSAFFTLLLIEGRAARWLLIILSAAATARYAWCVLVYFFYPHRYKPYTLASASQLLALFSIFFVGFSMTSLAVYLVLSPLLSAVGMWSAIVVVLAAGFISYRLSVRRSGPIILAVALVLTELFALLVLLPVPPAVAGALLAIFYYALSELTRRAAAGALERSLLAKVAALSLAGIVLITISARWV